MYIFHTNEGMNIGTRREKRKIISEVTYRTEMWAIHNVAICAYMKHKGDDSIDMMPVLNESESAFRLFFCFFVCEQES